MIAFGRDQAKSSKMRRPTTFRVAMLPGLVCLGLAFALPSAAFAIGPNAVLTPTGYNSNTITRGDDNNVRTVVLPFTMNWFGTTYNRVYINQNGNVTFTSGLTAYTPTQQLNAVGQDIMAPFWADVDTGTNANPNAGQTSYSSVTTPPKVNGRNAIFINWIGVGYYNHQNTPLNSFQIVIIDRSDTGAGNFDFMYNYDQVLWDLGSASGTQRARAGWGRNGGTYYELPGSGSTAGSTLLDTSPAATSLVQNYLNADQQLGRYVWQVRNGQAPNMPPKVVVTNRTLEGNMLNGYTGYTGSGDTTATDVDGSIASFTSSLPATLPLGLTNVLWTATDNRGAVTTESQSVIVTDTTAPANPALVSPTHAVNVWSNTTSARINWSGASDACSGVDGYSYSWSSGAAAVPDTVKDAATSTVTSVLADGTSYFNLRTVDKVGNWSATTSYGPIRIDTAKPTTTNNAPSGWSTGTVPVTLTATDPSGPVAGTRFRLNGSASTTYSAPVAVSAEGTNTLEYWSVDAAGNVEATKTVAIHVDTVAPTMPAIASASAVSTTSVEIAWSASSDSVSGLAYYAVFRDGARVATSAVPSYTDGPLVAGQTYSYRVSAYDVAGNQCAPSAAVTETAPAAEIWLTISETNVSIPAVDPMVGSAVPTATVVTVSGVGTLNYDFSCSGEDFANSNGASLTPTMPVGMMSFAIRGWHARTSQPFTNLAAVVDSDVGTKYVWNHPYTFDYSLAVPWVFEPGTYNTKVTYTAVVN